MKSSYLLGEGPSELTRIKLWRAFGEKTISRNWLSHTSVRRILILPSVENHEERSDSMLLRLLVAICPLKVMNNTYFAELRSHQSLSDKSLRIALLHCEKGADESNVPTRWRTWSPKIKEHRVGIMQHQLVPRCVLWQFSEISSYFSELNGSVPTSSIYYSFSEVAASCSCNSPKSSIWIFWIFTKFSSWLLII